MTRPWPVLLLALLLLGADPGLAWAQDTGQASLRERVAARLAQRRAEAAQAAQAAQADSAAAVPAAVAPLGPGTHGLTVTHGGLPRKVLVHLPTGYDARRPLPLVVALHGGGGHAAAMADDERYGLDRAADRGPFVVVFPNGYSRFPRGRLATWNAGGCCGEARDRQSDDVGFVRAVVAAVQARVAIDPARIFATGMSNGGMMAHRLACEASDLFRAVAAVAGTDATVACAPAHPVSVLVLHARDDDHVLFDGGAGPGAFRDSGQVMAFTSVPETVARWVRRDRCGPVASPLPARPGAHCEAYTGCAGGTSVQLCVTEHGGHAWPGAQVLRAGGAGTPQALDADALIWDFFRTSAAR